MVQNGAQTLNDQTI